MSRPIKNGLEYFSFDIDFFEDEKLEAISGEFGIKGELATVKLLCAIYRNGYFAMWDDLLKMKLLKRLPGVSSDLLEQIVLRLVKWGFFDEALFNSEKVLTSNGIQKRFLEATKRRSGSAITVYACNNGVNVNKNPVSVGINVNINPQSKVKESKVISMGDKSPSTPSFKIWDDKKFIEDIRVHGEDYPKDLLNTFFKYWSEKGASGKMKFQMEKTWETAKRLSNWQRNEEKWAK